MFTYKLTLTRVEKLEEVTAELHQMCLKVEKVIASDELMTKFRIPKHTEFCAPVMADAPAIAYSRLDPRGMALAVPNFWKITPIRQRHYTRRRSSVIWLEDQLNAGNLPEGSDQFNSLQEKLIDRLLSCRNRRRSCCISPRAHQDRTIQIVTARRKPKSLPSSSTLTISV